ncbi:MAG: RNA methyltransferase [Pseudomonadota bacterium]
MTAMAVEDCPSPAAAHPPCVILASPQLGENIGTAARAMANFGLKDLRLVTPRDGWPSEKARAASSGAHHLIDGARVFDSLDDAVADCAFVIATTRRERDMTKRVEGPEAGLQELCGIAATGAPTGILFGRERWGLENDEVARANIIVTFPVDPAFASLNVAQSVLLMAYEWRRTAYGALPERNDENPPATWAEVTGLWEHLVTALRPSGYFRPPQMAEKMERNLLLTLTDAGWNAQQVSTLRGVLNHLTRARKD